MRAPAVARSTVIATATCTVLAVLVAATTSGYSATGIETQGPTALGGQLAALRLAGPGEQAPPRQAPTLRMEGTDFWIETDHQQQNLSVVVGSPVPPDTWTTREVPESGRMLSAEVRPSYDVFILPMKGAVTNITIQSDAADLGQSQAEHLQQKDVMIVREPLTADVADAHEFRGDVGRHLTLSGSFVAVFWEWDLEVTSENETYSFPSGYTSNETVSVSEELRGVGSTYQRQTYVYVRDGVLSLRAEESTWMGLFLVADQVAVDGRMVLRDAVPLQESLKGEDREFKGTMHAFLSEWNESRFQVEFRPGTNFEGTGPGGQPATVEIQLPPKDEAPQSVSPSTSPDEGFGPFAWLSLLAVVPVAAGARYASEAHRYHHLNKLMQSNQYSTVVQKAPRLLRVRRFRHEAAVMQAVALLKLDRAADALRFLGGLAQPAQPDLGTYSYLTAASLARLGRHSEAANELVKCLSNNPAYRDEVLSNSWFQPLLNHPSVVQSLSQGSTVPEEAYS